MSAQQRTGLTVIVLAAGGGTRMKSKTMKVLHPIGGRSMIGHVLTAAQALDPEQVVAVVGHQREAVSAHIHASFPDVVLAVQEEQHGTGHAVRMAVEAVAEQRGQAISGTVLVAYGDTPLLRGDSLREFADEHEAAQRAVSILSGIVPDPFGYGRVLRNDEGDVEAIVEEKDASPEQREVREINSGILAFDAEFLREALPRIGNDNAKGEYYLTDTIALAREDGLTVGAHPIDDVMQTEGVNDRVQLARIGAELNRRIVEGWMREGVTVVDPATTWIDADVVLGADVTILPGTQLLGATVVAEDAVIGPDTTLKDCEIGSAATVVRTQGVLAVVGAEAIVGPFSYLRPGTILGTRGKIGGFVETKNAVIGDGAKVPHLSYVGDAEIGEGTNIGAGTIFANYDGVNKHRTKVGKHARTSSNNTFVAPIEIGDGAATGAGTVVREDVPPGALAVSSGPQRNIEGWAMAKRAGTAQASAAEIALAGRRDDDQGMAES
ncbi:bifunctional N-acetylglucosamine-1-phosphate uridyltransferase/glucosamine-1-phosphate acetyltransferase [Nocardioides sp. Root1257]|uniref:bifunctional UDP-N-acetylglucosamine diphosphorylase/glucosamine-1-phosphate N-acetyltransferase GlmU n=1 Tax=unclassified Nocardioides TaxID=2615069 RepID=UPI0006FD1495|nr:MULTISPECIES: bifunctional UDP-N-acetylglucosamine diphosphorylase/glucosamine-1-phosphate N-acetyltransferase GlmU [unclassified Nocardioides]KQW48818.1 bifunctional N-acetylglucosamine-1-phosphate uridyltransferase/glucosamine-1-phosphate acetyltransferase [Nocardioides sp. Root1257]KRC47993.1 bifunctional N-acetylglucosamine-1-phosphate uridyltransferase/glucosamine-1-phosphate acetyltransferase [Nocardioides sp. Root224]